jgi:hypothetical protein
VDGVNDRVIGKMSWQRSVANEALSTLATSCRVFRATISGSYGTTLCRLFRIDTSVAPELSREPAMQSLYRSPGTARSSNDAGRSLIVIAVVI